MATPGANLQFSLVPSGAASPAAAGMDVSVMVPPLAPQAVPNGMSPNGKRPRSDQSAAGGRPPMSVPELSTAMNEMQPLLRSTAEED